MNRSAKITISVIVFAAIMIIATSLLSDPPDYSSTFYVDATWYPDEGNVKIVYNDTARATQLVTLEVLGLAETFHVSHMTSNFVETVSFDRVPSNGWRAHPVTFDITHSELGDIAIKVEIHRVGEPAPHIIYGRVR